MCFLSFFISQCNLLVWLWFLLTDWVWIKQTNVTEAAQSAEFKRSSFNFG